MKKIYLCMKIIFKNLKVFHQKRIEIKKINEKRRKQIYKNIIISKEDEKKTQGFYKKYYGKKISLKWHKEYYAISGKFDYKFFPELLFIPKFETLLNNPNYYKCFQDKNVTSLIAKGLDFIKPINVYAKCVNNLLTDSNDNIISINDLHGILEEKKVFIKPTVDSNSGRNCRVCHFINGVDKDSQESLVNIINSYGKNFVIQKLIKNSPSISKLNPSCLNTFRVITYILDGKIYHFPVILRLGRDGKIIDNAHAGGIFIGVEDDGTLLDFAITEFGGKFYKHPDTGVMFKDYKISNFNKILEAAYKMQTLVPQVRCVNWDFTLDENEEVVLIEANMKGGSIWLPQMAHGKGAFGDNTARVLEIIRANKELY